MPQCERGSALGLRFAHEGAVARDHVRSKDFSLNIGQGPQASQHTGIYTYTVRYLLYKYKLLLPVSGAITGVCVTYLHNQLPVQIAYFVQLSLTPHTPLFSLSLILSLFHYDVW